MPGTASPFADWVIARQPGGNASVRCGIKPMKLSTKGRYAVMAMVDIGQQSGNRPVSLADIAERQEISQEYLEQLFGKLRKNGLVESARGPGGGYRLARDPEDITIGEIIVAVDEPLRVTRCEGDAIDG